jgi:hypothetical protein
MTVVQYSTCTAQYSYSTVHGVQYSSGKESNTHCKLIRFSAATDCCWNITVPVLVLEHFLTELIYLRINNDVVLVRLCSSKACKLEVYEDTLFLKYLSVASFAKKYMFLLLYQYI